MSQHQTDAPPSLLKQLMGAATGSLVALCLYYSYKWTAPRVAALLSPAETTEATLAEAQQPATEIPAAQDEALLAQRRAEAEEQERRNAEEVAARARAIAARMQEQPAAQPAPAVTDLPAFEPPRLVALAEPLPAPAPEWRAQPQQVAAAIPTGDTHAGAPNLPQSGISTMAALTIAGALAGAKKARRRAAPRRA